MPNLQKSERGSGALFVLIFVIVLAVAFVYMYKKESTKTINSFEDCVAAGYPIQESYPEVCSNGNGRSFANPAQLQ